MMQLETWFALLRTVGVFAVIFGIWIVVQTIVRKQSGCRGDKDPLDYMAHGCANCTRKPGECSRRIREDSHHHELA
jgi:hypothetical protein